MVSEDASGSQYVERYSSSCASVLQKTVSQISKLRFFFQSNWRDIQSGQREKRSFVITVTYAEDINEMVTS